MRSVVSICVVVLVVMAGAFHAPHAAVAQSQGRRVVVALSSDQPTSDQRALLASIDSWIASGSLRLIDRRDDPLVPNVTNERYQQTYNGLSVLGADVVMQRRSGQVISAFGIVFDGLSIDTDGRQSFGQITSMLTARGVRVDQASGPLGILPTDDGQVALVYAVRVDDTTLAFVDASDATVRMQLSRRHTQTAVGQGTGTLGDTKKMSTTNQAGSFVSEDGLRPPALQTFDLQGNSTRAILAAEARVSLGAADLARTADNNWTDGAIVDAHVSAGRVYDYYYRRFQRHGLDGNDIPIQSIVHPVVQRNVRTASNDELNTFYLNAFYSSDCRCMVYGEGVPPGVFVDFPQGVRNFATALDVVGHELTHAVTDASSRLIYANESGALNEAFSDIMGTSIEFFYQPVGNGDLKADYLMGEDLAPGRPAALMRSMVAPATYGQPDHYFNRQYIGTTTADSGGVHINSGIANNAFYLAIEGGTNPSSLARVTGVGAANREQIEKAFYRAFTSLLPSSATFYMARVATAQAARDLYGSGSSAERAIASAWDAVGVYAPAAALTTKFSSRTVTATNAACSGARPSFSAKVSVSEFQGVGFTVQGFAIYTIDAQFRQIALKVFTASTFKSTFGECQPGSTRIGAGATACATLCSDLGGRTTGYALFDFYGSDDNGNFGEFISDPLSIGLPAINQASDTIDASSLRKVAQR